MRRPYIKTVSSTASSVLAGGTVPIGNTLVTGYCKAAMTLNGNSSVSINDNCVNGYLIAVNATFTAPAAGTVVLNVSRNGTPIEGATASAVVSTANTEVHSLSFTTTVKSLLAAPDTLSIVNAGVAANFSNVELDIYRL
nr:MAG TPA: hypothetical protein [Caudoviricetes sp.]